MEQTITGIRDRLTFIGYPTLDDSIHLVDSFGQLAVSSSAEHPEKCVELALHLEVSQETVDDFRAAINSADAVSCNDSGLYCIIYEEVESYYSQGKPVGEIAKSLHSRINLYLSERQF